VPGAGNGGARGIGSSVLGADPVPAGPWVVPDVQRELVVYDPTGAAATGLFPDIPADVAAEIVASNALPVVIVTPGPDDLRPVQRP